MKERKKRTLLVRFKNARLQTKITLLLFLLLFLPSILFAIYSAARVRNTLQEQNLAAARKSFDETVSAFNVRLERVTSVMDLLIYDPLVYSMASTNPVDYPYISQWEDSRELSNSFEYLTKLSDVESIRMYVKNDFLFSNDSHYILPLRGKVTTDWYKRLLVSSTPQWFVPGEITPTMETDTFACMHMIYDPEDPHTTLAVLRVDLNSSVLESAINASSPTDYGIVLLLQNGQPILSYSHNDIPYFDDTQLQLLKNQWNTVTINSTNYYSYSTDIIGTDWTLATLIPLREINAVSNRLQMEMIGVISAIAFVSFLLALALSHHIFHRIWDLSGSMQSVEDGNMDIHLVSDSQDEIGQLITHFNTMMERLRRLIDEKVAYGVKIKSLELKSLQAQINPHFLYNTLDTIKCLALQHHADDISQLVSALATFYKISLSKGREFITLKEELLHSKMYLRIFDYRFEGQVITHWNIDPKIEEISIPKITLQPIIENAVIHGIFEREGSTGTLHIKAWREADDVYISIADNGVGMTPEVIAANFAAEHAEPVSATKGYGVSNVNERLRIAYGPGYGLSCTSVLHEGTTVLVHIPAKQ